MNFEKADLVLMTISPGDSNPPLPRRNQSDSNPQASLQIFISALLTAKRLRNLAKETDFIRWTRPARWMHPIDTGRRPFLALYNIRLKRKAGKLYQRSSYSVVFLGDVAWWWRRDAPAILAHSLQWACS